MNRRLGLGGVGFVVWWRHFRSSWSILGAIGLVILVVSASVALAPRILQTATADDLTETIRTATPEQRNIRLHRLTEIGAGAPGRAFSNIEWFGDQFRDNHIPPSVVDLVSEQQWLFDSPQFVVGSYPDQIEVRSAPVSTTFSRFTEWRSAFRFREQSGIEEHSRLIAGAMPVLQDPEFRLEGPECPEEVADIEEYEPEDGVECQLAVLPLFQTALSQITADELELDVGDRVMLRPLPSEVGFQTSHGVDGLRIILELSGIIELDPIDDAFWYGDELLHRPRTFENSDFRFIFGAGLLGGEQYRSFRAAVNGASLDFSWRYLLDADLVEGVDSEQLAIDVEKIAPPDVDVVTLLPELLQDHLAQRRLTLQVWSLIGAVFAAAAAAVVWTLARGDAVRRRSISGLMADRGASSRQLLLLDVATAIVVTGVGVGAGSVIAWAAFADTSSRAPVLAASAFGLLCILAMSIAGRTSMESGRTRLVVMSGFLIILAAVVVVLLRRRDSGVEDAARGAFDLTLTVAPVLVVSSIAVFGSWLVAPLARAGARLAARTRGALWLIGLRRLGAQRDALRGPLLAVAMAAGLAVLAAVVSTSIASSQEEAAEQSVGAEYRVEMTIIDIGLPARLQEQLRELDPEVTFGTVLPFERFIGPSSGFVADLVALDNWSTSLSGDAVSIDLVGVWNASHLPAPGDRVTLTSGAHAVEMDIRQQFDRVAGLEASRAVIVVDRAALAEATNEPFAAPTMALLGDGVDRAALEALIEDVPAIRVVSRRDELAAITDDPLSTWTGRGLLVGLLGGVALAFAAAVAAVMTGSPTRTRDLSLLTVIGLERRGVVRVAMAELAPLFAVTIALGLISGVVTAQLLGPNLSLEAFSGGAVSSGVVVDGWTLLLVSAVLVGALGLALWLVARTTRRLDHAMMLRRGSD